MRIEDIQFQMRAFLMWHDQSKLIKELFVTSSEVVFAAAVYNDNWQYLNTPHVYWAGWWN